MKKYTTRKEKNRRLLLNAMTELQKMEIHIMICSWFENNYNFANTVDYGDC